MCENIILKYVNFGSNDSKRSEAGKDLENFLKQEQDLLADRMKSKDTEFDPYTKDTRIVDAK